MKGDLRFMKYPLGTFKTVRSFCVAAVLFGTNQISGEDYNYISPIIAQDGLGNMVSVYLAQNDSGNAVVIGSTCTAGSPWSSPTQLSDDSESAQNIQIASDASSGVILVTWTALDIAAGTDFVLATTYKNSDGWGTTNKISLPTEDGAWDDQKCSVAASGVMAVVWTSYINGTQAIRSANGIYGTTGSNVGPWNTPVTLASPNIKPIAFASS